VGWALVHFLWQGMAIAAVLAIALLAARRAPASFRYALCAIAMVLMIAVPAGTVVRLQHSPRPTVLPAGAASPTADEAGPSEATRADTHKSTKTRNAIRAAETAAPSSISPVAVSRFELLRLGLEQRLHWLVAFWVLGVFVLSVRLLGGFLRARQLTHQGTSAVPEVWRHTLARLARRLGITAEVRILQSALVVVPVVIGWLRPVILLPGTVFTGLTPQQLEAILAHELAHIRRHDYLVNLVQAAIETVLFYHPAVWWVSRRLRAEREHCCDDLAVAACGDAHGYATALVDMERLRGAALAFALGAGGSGGSLVTRVRRLLAPPFARAETAPRWAAGVIAVVAALAVGGVSGVPAAVAERADQPQAQRSQAPDTVLKHPDPAAPLAERWSWAERQARTVGATGYWIGYTITPPAGLDHMVYIDRKSMVLGDGISMSGRMFGDFNGFRFPGQSIAALVGGGAARSIKLLFEFRGTGQLGRVHASTFELPVDLGGHALLWLGAATDQQSLALVEPLYGAAPSPDMKEQVIDAIGVHGTSALVVPALERRLAANEPNNVRAQAAEWLGWHPLQPALALLARLARGDRSRDVRHEAAEAIGEMKLPAATDTLIALVRTLTDVDTRREAVEGLGQKDELKAREALAVVAREDRQSDVQREAVETLGELDGPEGIAALRNIVRSHPNPEVRREAVETLGETLAPAEAVPLLNTIATSDANSDVQREAIETLGEVGTNEARATVLAIAKSHPEPDVRREAVETLGQAWPSDDIVEELIRLAKNDRNPDVQREAVETLGEIDGSLGLGAVVELAMTHPHPDVRREAIETVGEHAAPAEALRILRDVIRNDQSSDVQREAVETLAEVEPGPATIELLDSIARSARNQDVRVEAIETLGEMQDSRALERVARIARTHADPETRREAVETLGEQSSDTRAAVTIISGILNEDASMDVQEEALETLLELPGGVGIPAVIQAARSHRSPDMRRSALRRLAESDDPRARAIFERALGNP
jgi:HEAT repeat protein/beta-lactamase regulating signal transducer with metallopeptidase domain